MLYKFKKQFYQCRRIGSNFFFSKGYSKDVRVRFAPSPTGYLHLGGLRTALYNFLFAKSNNGKFILRIEDTDQTRLVEGASEQLQKDLKWAGIKIDEGPLAGGNFGPYVQSQRLNIYRENLKILLENGSAYHCFCSDKRLNLLRREALKMRQVPKYDNRCRHLTPDEVKKKLNKGEEYCIRFKLLPDCETFEDIIYGNIAFDVSSIEGDPVIMKSDGYPTYHYANVVDDHFMKISHVLRGVEWQVSTTKHILIYRAFGWEPPSYGHLPLLINSDGTKLSKRQGDIKISHYRDSGIFPQALINYITNCGGGFEKDLQQGIKPKCYSMKELADQFKIKTINTHSGRLAPERLLEFNRLELQRKLQNKNETNILVQELQALVKDKFVDTKSNLQLDETYIQSILNWSSNRIDKLSDLVSKDMSFLWILPDLKQELSIDDLKIIENLSNGLNNQIFEKEKLVVFFKSYTKEKKYPFKKLMKNLRMAVSGLQEGPSVGEMFEILGKDNTVQRLQIYLKKNRSR